MERNDFIKYIVRDNRYAIYTLHELKVMRKNMIEDGVNKYELALVQYEIMKKEGTLSNLPL